MDNPILFQGIENPVKYGNFPELLHFVCDNNLDIEGVKGKEIATIIKLTRGLFTDFESLISNEKLFDPEVAQTIANAIEINKEFIQLLIYHLLWALEEEFGPLLPTVLTRNNVPAHFSQEIKFSIVNTTFLSVFSATPASHTRR